jgi:D-glycero-alpha-D-manno-heptose 1-phosphate guanylyltransferase
MEDSRLDGVVLAVRVADAARFGTLQVDEDGMLAAFREKQPGAGLVNAGTYAFRREALARFLPPRPMSLEADIIPELLRMGATIGVAVVDAPFIDIGVPESLGAAEAFVATYRAALDGG